MNLNQLKKIQDAFNKLFKQYNTYDKIGTSLSLKISCDLEPLVATINKDGEDWLIIDGFSDDDVQTFIQVVAMTLIENLSFQKEENFICYILQIGDEWLSNDNLEVYGLYFNPFYGILKYIETEQIMLDWVSNDEFELMNNSSAKAKITQYKIEG